LINIFNNSLYIFTYLVFTGQTPGHVPKQIWCLVDTGCFLSFQAFMYENYENNSGFSKWSTCLHFNYKMFYETGIYEHAKFSSCHI